MVFPVNVDGMQEKYRKVAFHSNIFNSMKRWSKSMWDCRNKFNQFHVWSIYSSLRRYCTALQRSQKNRRHWLWNQIDTDISVGAEKHFRKVQKKHGEWNAQLHQPAIIQFEYVEMTFSRYFWGNQVFLVVRTHDAYFRIQKSDFMSRRLAFRSLKEQRH